MGEKLVDSFSVDDNHWEMIDEKADGSSVVDGISIIGRATGKFFAVDDHSNNKRFYGKGLWEKAIKSTNDIISRGQMLGTIGHDQPLDEKAIAEGLVSHKVSKLWIQEDKKSGKKIGMGEILILNTNSGRNLNTVIRSGTELPVSSRGYGGYKGKVGGSDVVDEDNFKLETFDFVRCPGITGAVPKIVENQKTEIEEKVIMAGEITSVDPIVLKSLTEEKGKLESKLESALNINEEIRGQVKLLKETKVTMEEGLAAYSQIGLAEEIKAKLEAADKTTADLATATKKIEELTTKVDAFTKLGEADAVTEELESLRTALATFEEVGSADKVNEAFDKLESALGEYKNLGSALEIDEAFNASQSFVESVKDLGSVSELAKCLDLLEEYVTLGSTDDISKAFDMVEDTVARFKAEALTKEAAEFSEEHGISTEMAESLIEKLGKDKAAEFVSEIVSKKDGVRYKIKESANGDKIEEKINPMNETRGNRLLRSMSR